VRKVLILPRHSSQAASCRHRFTQYLPALAARGFDCTVAPLFDEVYTRSLLAGAGRRWWHAAVSAFSRLEKLAAARRYDLVVIHTELLPYVPAAFERLLAARATPYVLDFDDAFFHQYEGHASRLVRRLLSGKIESLVRGAALNVAGSDYLAGYARRFSDSVAVVPTAVDLARYPSSAPPCRGSGPFQIAWIGSPSTTPHLQSIGPELREFCRRRNAEVVAIVAKPFDADGLPIRWIEWSEATEVEHLSRADVGIMPLPADAWAEGKCGFKLIQSMACWRPVVASPVGANRHVVAAEESGLLAEQGGWVDALDRLYGDCALRARFGAAGRRRVEEGYSLQVWAPVVCDLWEQACRS